MMMKDVENCCRRGVKMKHKEKRGMCSILEKRKIVVHE
jgi:hypothetical protein